MKSNHNKAISRRIFLSPAYSVGLLIFRCENIYNSPDESRDYCFKELSIASIPTHQISIPA